MANPTKSEVNSVLGFLDDKLFKQLTDSGNGRLLLDVFHDAIDENAFSRILAYFTDSTESHGLGKVFLKNLLAKTGFKFKISSPMHSHATFSWRTLAGGFVDIVVVVKERSRNGAERISLVAGIENKVNAKERADQLADYQHALTHAFPGVPKLMIFLSPSGKPPTSSSKKLAKECPVVCASYGDIVKVSKRCLDHCENPGARVLLKELPQYIEKRILATIQEDKMRKSLKTKILSNSDHAKALRFISRNIFLPNMRNLVYEFLVPELQANYPGSCVEWHYPRSSPNPKEFNIALPNMTKGNFEVYYQLSTPEYGEDNGYAIRLMAWCGTRNKKSPSMVRYVERMREKSQLPAEEGPSREWNVWKCIWAGPEYRIKNKEIESLESEGLKNLLLDTIGKTYKPLVKYLRAHAIK